MFQQSFVTLLGVLVLTDYCSAVRFANAFGDHMVLQRDTPVNVWGFCDGCAQGTPVSVSCGQSSAAGTVDATGTWHLQVESHYLC